jgi:pimeloyl-ACP methyl ester carboxylesterase
MSKKIKVPIMLRVVRWWFPRLEKYSPSLATRLFVQLFFTPLHYGFPDKEQEWIRKAEKSSLEVSGKRVQFYSWGEAGQPFVLFVHGWAGRGTQFRKFFPVFLEAGYRIVTFDGPAHGKSSGKRTNIIEFEEVLRKLLDKTGEPACVIAHSFGGVVSLMGIVNGLPIKKLINIGSPVIGDKIIQTFLTAVNGTWASGERFKTYMIQKYNRSFDEFSGEYFLPRIHTPLNLMLVHDENDKDVSIDHAEKVTELYPKAILHRTAGLGHTRILKDEEVIRRCLNFIQQDG